MPKRKLPTTNADAAPRLWRLGEFELDEARPALRRGETVMPLAPKPFRLLLVLLQQAGQVVSHQQLLDRIWEGRAVSDAVISRCASTLRSALGEQQAWVRTVHGQGYRYEGPVEPPEGAPVQSPEVTALAAEVPAITPEVLPTPVSALPAPPPTVAPLVPRAVTPPRSRQWRLPAGLAVALCIALGFAVHSHRAQQKAEAETAAAEAINRFIDDELLAGTDPLSSDGSGELPLAGLLDAAAEKLRHTEQTPAVAARLAATLGGAYYGLSLLPASAGVLESGLKNAEAQLGGHAVETNLLRMRLARTLTSQGKFDRALILYQSAVRELADAPNGHAYAARENLFLAQIDLGRLQYLRGQYADCGANIEAQLASPPPGADVARVAEAQWSLARCLIELHQYDRASALLDEARSRAAALPGAPQAMLSLIDLSRCELWNATGRWAESRQLATAIGQQPRGGLSAQYQVSLDVQYQQSLALLRMGQVQAARTQLERLYQQRRDSRGDGDRATLLTANLLGEAWLRDGATAQARTLLTPAYARSRQDLGASHPNTLSLGNTLAEALAAGGDTVAARTLGDAVIDAAQNVLPVGDPALARYLMAQGALRLQLGDTEAARSAADAADKTLQQSQVVGSPLRAATQAAVESGDFSLRWRL